MAETIEPELAPISPEAPCGPDLDAEGDLEFMNFLAAYEGQLPDSYFSFDRKTIDFPAAFAAVAQLRGRTQDLRLVILCAKLAILNRDFYRFAREVAEVAWLLKNRWDEVHPRAERGNYAARLAQLGTLDDSPVVVLPLQYATLLQSEREGPLPYRAVMVTQGDANPREGEKLPNAPAIERLLASVDIEALARAYATLARLHDDLEATSALTAERVDFERAVKFNALATLVAKMRDFAHAALARRDPTLAPPPPAAEGGGVEAEISSSPGGFESLSDVDGALAAALAYFQTREPSSPAVLLIAQARATLGKNIFEVVRQLTPRFADSARVFVGPGDAFSVPVNSLSDAPSLDFSAGEATPAESRAQALHIVEKVCAHLRSAEPSSPVPYLLDRARSLASRDFLSLLGEIFPKDDLQSMRNRD